MGDVGETFKALRGHVKEIRKENLNSASSDGWKKHTPYHWYRDLNGKRLDYWPSRNKFQYEGKVMTGGIDGFIKKRTKTTTNKGD